MSLSKTIAVLLVMAGAAACDDGGDSSARDAGRAVGLDESVIQSLNAWGAGGGFLPGTDPFADNIVLVIDGSGSMDEPCGDVPSKWTSALDALLAFVDGAPRTVNLGLVGFLDGEAGVWVAITDGASARGRILDTVGRLGPPTGNTPLGDAAAVALDQLRKQSLRQAGYGRYSMVFVTDGVPQPARQMGVLERQLEAIAATPVEVMTIGFCIDRGHPLNVPGQNRYQTATNATELLAALNTVLAETSDFDAASFD